jgi:hypothetical protein
MRCEKRVKDERGQMLLATGMVLLLALLLMAYHSTKIASLGSPYDSAEDAVIITATEVESVWTALLENRSSTLVESGTAAAAACQAAADSARSDLMRHGEHRGVEVILSELNATYFDGICTISASAGIADRHARLQFGLNASFVLTD